MTAATVADKYEEWCAARLGRLTSSRMSDATARTKTGWSTSRRKLMVELIAERLTGMATQSYLSQAMQWGLETEAQARAAYEQRTGQQVTLTGFVDHPKIPNSGCSPDGLVGYDGLVEIKCPETRTHIGYLLDRKIPEEYQIQMHWQMACCQRAWADFVSFDPRLPLGASYLCIRLNRDEAMIKGLEKLAIGFLQEMVHMLNAIENPHLASEDTI